MPSIVVIRVDRCDATNVDSTTDEAMCVPFVRVIAVVAGAIEQSWVCDVQATDQPTQPFKPRARWIRERHALAPLRGLQIADGAECGKTVVAVVEVLGERAANLTQVVRAVQALGSIPRAAKCGHQKPREHRHDSDDHQQFKQCEATLGERRRRAVSGAIPRGSQRVRRCLRRMIARRNQTDSSLAFPHSHSVACASYARGR